MPCVCRTNTLALFVRRVAHVDLELYIRHGINRQSVPVTRRNISISQCLELDHTPKSRNHLPKSPLSSSLGETRADEQKPAVKVGHQGYQNGSVHEDVLTGNTNRKNELLDKGNQNRAISMRFVRPEAALPKSEGRGAGYDIPVQSFPDAASPNGQQDKGGAGVFEITPEAIDALAADSLRNAFHSRSHIVHSKHISLKSLVRATIPSLNIQRNSSSANSASQRRERQKYKQSVNNPRISSTSTPERVPWQIQKAALREKFKEGWSPRKRLSPDALAGIRAIHAQFPQQYTTNTLAEKFEVSPEAIRRILKGKWTPKEEEETDRQRRWFARGQKVWNRYAELGLKPPAKWRKLGIGKREPSYFETQRHQTQSESNTNITARNAGDLVRIPQDDDRAGSLAERIL